MRIDWDKWEEILLTITRNKTRSLLTAFGIFWGIFMLVLLMGGGQGLQRIMASNFEGFATNSCFTFTSSTTKAYKGFRKGRTWDLENKDVLLVRQSVPELQVVSAINARWGKQAERGNRKRGCTLKGQYPEYVEIETPHISSGRYINDVDVLNKRKVCVIGKRIAEELFPDVNSPCGNWLRIDGVYYQVIGVNSSTSHSSVMGDVQSSVVIPFSTMQQIYRMGAWVSSICFTVKPGYTVNEVAPKVESVLKRAHLIHPEDKQALQMINMELMFQMVDNLFKGIRMLVWLIGLGTLLSGAVGVSNIMMVTVKERTTEIGIRRAIGARPKDILWQILSESILLTIIAGLLGICMAVGILQLVEKGVSASMGQNISFQVSFMMALGAALLLAVLGALAGLAPAFRALAIKPIDAMRDE